MFIDIHSHAYRKKVPFICNFCTAEELIARYDELGIAKGVVLPIVSPEIYFPQTNEDILDMAEKYPDRIIPFCNVDPRALTNSPNAPLDKVLSYYKERGCKGLGEVMANLPLMDPLIQNLLYHAEKVGLPVTLDGSDQLTGDFGVYDDLGLPQLEHTLQRFPDLIIFGHGPTFWSELGRLETPGERGIIFKFRDGGQVGRCPEGPILEEGVVPKLLRRYPNLYGDLSDFTPFRALTRDPEFGAKFLTEFQDRMYFGTDIVSPTMEVSIIGMLNDWRDSGRISQEVYEKIAYKNAQKLLGL